MIGKQFGEVAWMIQECEVAWTWLWGSFERMLPRGITWQAVEAVRGRFSVMWAPRGARGSGQIRSCLVSVPALKKEIGMSRSMASVCGTVGR